MSLREEVEKLLPEWRHWYGSLFDAALDLGVIRATVCDPSSLLLSNRLHYYFALAFACGGIEPSALRALLRRSARRGASTP